MSKNPKKIMQKSILTNNIFISTLFLENTLLEKPQRGVVNFDDLWIYSKKYFLTPEIQEGAHRKTPVPESLPCEIFKKNFFTEHLWTIASEIIRKSLSCKKAEAVICKCSKCSSKWVFLKISQNSQENTCIGVFFNKVAGLTTYKFIK